MRTARLLALAPVITLAVITLAGCTGVHGQHAQARSSSTPGSGCGPFPSRHAWAAEVTTAGRLRWETPLPTRDTGLAPAVAPVAVGPVALFAQDGVVHGIRLADGRQLWSWTGGQSVFAMWRLGGLVAVMTGPAGGDARLTGLDAATGAIRWKLRVPDGALFGYQSPTADGGVAVVTSAGVLEVVNLADGTIRWQRTTGTSAALVAADGVVVLGVNGRLTGYDDRTGRPRWMIEGLPSQPAAQLADGLILITGGILGHPDAADLAAQIAVVAATGRVAWRFNLGPQMIALSAGPAGVAVPTYGPGQLNLLDQRTGRLRWQVDTTGPLNLAPVVTRTAVITAEGFPAGRIVERDASDGRIRWQSVMVAGAQQLARAGSLILVQGEAARSGGPAPLLAYRLGDGSLAWRADLPAIMVGPPLPVPGGVLVQPADPVQACAAAG